MRRKIRLSKLIQFLEGLEREFEKHRAFLDSLEGEKGLLEESDL